MSELKLNEDRIIGIFCVFLVPIIILVSAIIYWLLSLPLMIVIIFVFGLIYAAFLSDKVDYGPKQIRKVRIPQVDENIERLLKTTTYSGDLIYVQLISVFENEDRLSQTELVKRIKKLYETPLTHQSIRNYIVKLEEHDLIHSPKTAREREYTLTDKGRECSGAIKACFPRTVFWFIIQHYLKIRKQSKVVSKSGNQKHM